MATSYLLPLQHNQNKYPQLLYMVPAPYCHEEERKSKQIQKLQICHHFTVDNLFHLKRGCRVSGATAIIGSVLKIKPLLHVDNEGKLKSVGKAMGRKKALSKLVENMFALAEMADSDPIFISHGDCADEVEEVKALIVK